MVVATVGGMWKSLGRAGPTFGSSTPRVFAMLLASTLLLAACTGGDDAATITSLEVPVSEVPVSEVPVSEVPDSQPTTTTEGPTTTAAPSTTAAEAATVPEDDGLIGTQEAYDELVDQVLSDARVRSGEDLTRENVPLPDLRVADPVEAFTEILEFDAWAYENLPVPAWADLWSERGSPYWASTVRLLDGLAGSRRALPTAGRRMGIASRTPMVSIWRIGTSPGLSSTVPQPFRLSPATERLTEWTGTPMRLPPPSPDGTSAASQSWCRSNQGWRIHDIESETCDDGANHRSPIGCRRDRSGRTAPARGQVG